MTFKKNTRHGAILRVPLCALAASLIMLVSSAWSDTTQPGQSDFTKRFYLGAGLGASKLQPNPRQPTNLAVGDEIDVGFHLNFGYDINRWLSAELYFAYLGEADIDQIIADNEPVYVDSIDYLIADVALLGYLYNSRSGLPGNDRTDGAFCREALSLYGRLGLGTMRNDAKHNLVTHDRNYRGHITVGVGLEYGFRNGVGIRGEWTGFDSDARYVNLSVVKRIGKSACEQTYRKIEPVTPVTTTPTSPPVPLIPLVPIKPPEKPDIDVPKPIVVPTSYFDFDVSTPDTESARLLTVFAAQIKDNPGTVQLTGHTDWSGSDYYNDQLSERRVLAVRQQLIDNGIAESRIEIQFRGEKSPAQSNESVTGRALNRRVNIVIDED